MPETEFPWLNGDEEVFRRASGGLVNADIGYAQGLAFYAAGYRRSAEMLFEAIRDGSYADSQYFAVAFLWRQALELTLKALHEDLGQLELLEAQHGPAGQPASTTARSPPKGHNLKKLWAKIEPRIAEIFPSEPETALIGRAIDRFHGVDPGAEGFRYPTKMKDGTPTLESLPRRVSFEDLDRDMRALLNTLEAAATEVRTRLDYGFEALAAMDEC